MTSKGTIIVCGRGPGISDAVARRFGREGHPVAIVARNADRLAEAARTLNADGVKAAAFPCDLTDADAVQQLVGTVRDRLGPIGIVHWNASTGGAGDLAVGSPHELRAVFDCAVIGLVAAVQSALPDLKAQRGAVLVTGGALGNLDPQLEAAGRELGRDGPGPQQGRSAQGRRPAPPAPRRRERLRRRGRRDRPVKGTAFDRGNATLDPAVVADRFWELAERRGQVSVTQS